MAVKLLFNDIPAFFDSNGDPLNGGKLFTYAAGSSTKQNTYTTSAGTVAHANPIILNSRGEPANAIWGTVGISYKLVLSPSTDSDPPAASFWTIDNITPINDANTLLDQWLTGPSPTYINATQFTLVGDQTTTFHVGRRLKTTNTGGSIYSTITTTAYTTLTTVTVVNDSGSLDSGLSAVSYGLLTASDAAVPWAKIASTGWTFIKAVTMSDVVTMSGKSIIEANASIAAHATTMNPWSLGNYVTATGTAVTFTDLADAPQAGAEVEIYMNAAHTWTNNANLEVDGNANYIATVGDRVLLRAKSTTVTTVHPRRKAGSGKLIQRVEATPYTAYTTINTAIPGDDTIPQNTEGAEMQTVSITPTNSNNRLVIRASCTCLSHSGAGMLLGAIFQDATADALAVGNVQSSAVGAPIQLVVTHEMAANQITETMFKFRLGPNSGQMYVNGNNTARLMGGLNNVRFLVEEIAT